MRIHRLRLQAFGPFPQVQEIDFDELGAAGLHLIHGATGSGKTSILDAICYAVFGQVAGSRNGLGGPACALADPGLTPEVEVETTIAGRRLRFVRRPEHHRPKKRGGGVTLVRSSVELHERGGEGWQPVSSRVQEVQHLVDTALGLRLDQFAQVIMLPQGGFAEFLHAEPDDRATVLRRLFDIERFADLERWFTGQRASVADQLARARQPVSRQRSVVEVCLSGLPGHGHGELDEGGVPSVWDAVEEDTLPVVVGQLAADVAREATASVARADAAERAARAARDVLLRGERASELHAKAAAAARVLADLDSSEAAVIRAADRVELDEAERAARVEPTARLLAELTTEADSADAARRAAVPDLVDALEPPGDSAVPADDRWWTAISAADRPISAAVESGTEAAARLRRAAAAAREERTLAERERAGATHLGELDRAVSELGQALASAEAEAGQVEPAGALVKLAQSASARVDRARTAREEEAVYAGAVQATDEALSVATQRAEERRRTRTAQLTGHLAAGLRAGEPCLVCGATEHPAPARLPDAAIVTEEDLERADEMQRAAREAYAAAVADFAARKAARQHAVAEAELALAEVRTVAADASFEEPVTDVPTGEAGARIWLHDVIERAQRWRALVRAAEATRTQLRAQASELSGEHAQHAADLIDIRLDRAAARARARENAGSALALAARTEDSLREHDTQCPCAPASRTPVALPWTDAEGAMDWLGAQVGDQPDQPVSEAVERVAEQVVREVSGRRDAHRELAAAVSGWRAAEQGCREIARRHRAAASALRRLLTQEDLPDAEAALTAARPASRREALRLRLETAERARTEAETVLADPEVAAVRAGPVPDLDELSRAADQAAAAARAAHDEASTCEHAQRTLHTAARDLTAALDTVRPLRERHAALDALAALLNAERGAAGERRMRLSAYVLAARLEEVVRLANERLGEMTDHRFTLEHDDGPGSRGARGGLGLRVHDAWTGSSRPTRSLSGGETFLAALALALALGDAIQQDAGGRQLETLFVDEGFGSLDEDSLDLVLGVLDELRSGGRTVGIVSHVQELRQRIPAQIEVRKSETGSSLRVRLPDTASVA